MSGSQNFANMSSLTDEIVDIIRDRILKGEYRIGEKIKENQIATEFKVSRTPIREAFKQLENEGLIDYIPNRGCFAKGFTRQDIEDIYAVRKALEIIA
ncbi:MAG: GntR family transcriptional regulator, partial [Firmicutes bacterium]|nr:GntR family transcriptional regulator [Bacillota bacterium]